MTIKELKKRVEQFNSLKLPGQPLATHMGTMYLINDLWREVQRLDGIRRKAKQLASVATDWNLDEVEINGEMVSTYDLLNEFKGQVK